MHNVKLFISIIIGALLICVAAHASVPAGVTEKNKALARRVFDEMLNQQKYEVFDEIYAKDFVKHVDGRQYSLAQEIEQAKAMHGLSSDLVMTVDQMIAEGDKVAIVYTGRGTNTGSFRGLAVTGKKVVLSGMTVYRFSDGKIAEEWTVYNEMEILRQLGYAPGATKD